MLDFQYNDGGREAAGYKGKVNDCVTRAIAIATKQPYETVYKALSTPGKSARNRLPRKTQDAYLKKLGWVWHPTMFIGEGCKVHLTDTDLPITGTIIVKVSKHLVTVIDGVIQDTHDCSRSGKRCVYGYWTPPETALEAQGATVKREVMIPMTIKAKDAYKLCLGYVEEHQRNINQLRNKQLVTYGKKKWFETQIKAEVEKIREAEEDLIRMFPEGEPKDPEMLMPVRFK